MKPSKTNNVLEGIKKEQLKRLVFSLEYKAEVVRHRKAVNLSFPECGCKWAGRTHGRESAPSSSNGDTSKAAPLLGFGRFYAATFCACGTRNQAA